METVFVRKFLEKKTGHGQAVADVGFLVVDVDLLQGQRADGKIGRFQNLLRHDPDVAGSGQVHPLGVAEDGHGLGRTARQHVFPR